MKKLFCILLLAVPFLAGGKTFQTDAQFSITLPGDWVEVPKTVLDEVFEKVAELSPGAPRQVYDYGYQLENTESLLQYPYILVQVKNVGRVASGELNQHKKLQEGFEEGLNEAAEGFSELLSNASFGEPVHDEKNHILWTTLAMDVEGIGKVNSVMAVKLTERGIIQFSAYATESTFNTYAEIFRNAFINLDIDESIAYKPQLMDHAPVWGGINMGSVLAAGIRGALIGGIFGLFFWLNKRKKKKNS